MDFCETKHNNTKHRQNCLTFRSMSKWRSKMETILLFVAFLFSNIPLSQAFTDARVYTEPTTVQYKMAHISFYGIPEQSIPAGGYIKLIVPDEITTYSTGISCFNVGSTKFPCTVRVTSRNQFTIDLTYEIRAGTQFEFKILNAINNPQSEKPSDIFQLLTSSNESIRDSDLLRIEAKRGNIDRYTLTPVSQVVGASTQLRVEFSSKHIFPKNGYILMDFPKWNPNNPLIYSRKTFIQGSESCASIRILSRDLFCEFKDDRLIIQKSATVDISGGTILEFEVTGFKNPIEANQVDGFKIQTAILFGTKYYVIDEGVTSLAASQFATLSLPRLSVINTDDPKSGMIQEINEMRLDFYLPVPLNAGCKVKIVLPIQYSVDYIEALTTKMAFGSITTFTVQQGNLLINRLERSLALTGACKEYIENDKVATIEINSLRQPNYEKTTDSVQIIITTKDDYFVANVTEKVTFTPQRGNLKVQTDAVVKVVQDRTQVMFELTPQHAIYVADSPKIHVDFPQELQIQTDQCSISNVSMTGSTKHIAEECVRNRQTFIISNYLAEDYIPAAIGEPPKKIYFTVGYVLNPISVQTVNGIDVTTYAFGQYAIDEWKGFMGWTIVTGDFIDAKVVPSSPVTYAFDVFYTISFTPTHLVPQNGYIEIDFPKQIAVPDYSYSQSSCRANETSAFGTNQITCEFLDGVKLSDPFRLKDPATPDVFTMRILQAFRRSSVEGRQEYSLVIPGFRNPIQTLPTLSFRFRTFDQAGRPIDDKSSGVEISMTQSSILDIVLVTLGSYTNAKLTDYTVTMVPTVPVWDINLVFITFPAQIKLPESSVDLNCTTVFDKIFQDIKCSYDPMFPISRSVRVDMTFAAGVKQIDPLDRFAITMQNIRNPTTTQTTDSIQVRITTRNSYSNINQKLSGTVITTNNPYSISQATVRALTPQPGVESAFILEFYPEHAINSGGGILIVYPPQTLLGKTQKLSAEIQIDGYLINQALLSQSFDLSARALTIQNIVQFTDPYEPKPGDKIKITLHGLKTPFTSAETSSFQMMTFNLVDETYYYFIDQVQNGLTINSKCNYPCKDCIETDPGYCLGCYPKDPDISNGRPFLQVNTCVEECAVGRYYDAKTDRCELCDPTCLSCFGSAQTCTACGIENFLFLHETQCLTQCPDRFIEDQSANRCKACQGNCLTCEGLPTSCTSCDKKSAFPFFFHESCIASCIPDISVQVGDKCVECDSKCKTCSGKTNYCTSCDSHMKMDPFKNTCEDLCEREVQVYNPLTMQCEKCASTCTKCAGKSSTCTECKKGFLLNFDQTCKETCSSANQIPIDGVCTACSEPCFKCGPSVNTCQSCIPQYSLYLGTKCVQYCPTKYESKDNVCIYEGLVCPKGFELNSTKDGCIPIKFECDPGYMINEQKTACVPKPGSQLPFPFLLTAVLICFLVLGSYLKDKIFTKVKTNLIACIGALELIMYVIMAGYAYQLNEILILVFTLIGLAGLLASNILFVAYYRQQIVLKDPVFAKWIHFFPKTRFWLPMIALLVNFKFGKLLYSGFYGLESTMARFERHAQFYYLLRLSAYFSFVFCYGFIFIADALIIWRVSWGYQLFVLAIETIILQGLIMVLTVIEFRQGALALLNNQGEQFAMIKPNQGQVRVMGGLEEDDYHKGIPDKDKEETLILEINLRRQALARILDQVGGHPTEKGVDIKDCFTKFDPERIRQRRCFSMCTSLDSDKSWVVDGDQPENKAVQKEINDGYGNITDEEPRERRYSFPMSPTRLKNLQNTLVFSRQIDDIKKANRDFLIDNVYTEAKCVMDPFIKRKVKTVSRRTQTYLRELLQVEGEEVHESAMEVLIEEEAEIDYNFAKSLIANVIEHISSADESPPTEKKTKKKFKKVFKPKKEIPDFELADIMGDFEIDDMGNFIIMRGDGGELMDQRERLVNRRGYLIDRFGNIINTFGNIIFKAIELDVDDEIPAPFGFEKRKKNLLKLDDENQFRVETKQKSQTDLEGSHLNLDDEDLLDKEVNGIKERSKQMVQKESLTSPTPEELEQTTLQQAQIKEIQHLDKEIIDQEENLEAEIDRLVKKKVPKKRKTLKTGKFKHLDNLPPKRIRPEDIQELFPHLSIEHDEQRRLAKIASSISGLATQLADKQRQQMLVDNRMNSITLHQQPVDWKHMQEEQKLERIRQDHLNDIMASSEQAFTEQMQERPGSNTGSLNFGGLNIARQMSAVGRPDRDRSGLRRNRSLNKPNDSIHDRTYDLKKVYGHIVDLSGVEEKNQTPISQGPPMGQAYRNHSEVQTVPRRGQSGKPGGRMAGLESIYINKMPKLKPPMNMNKSQMSSNKARNPSATRPYDYNPFRPTLDRFADDPTELNVNTQMRGGLAQGGRDILEIAQKLDRMQREYLSQNRSGPQTLKNPHAGKNTLTEQKRIAEQDGNFAIHQTMVSDGGQSHYVHPTYSRLQVDARTSSGRKRLAANSDANDSIDMARKDNWMPEE